MMPADGSIWHGFCLDINFQDSRWNPRRSPFCLFRRSEAYPSGVMITGIHAMFYSPEAEAREERRKTLYDICELAAKFFEATCDDPVVQGIQQPYRYIRGDEDRRMQKARIG